MFNAEIYRARRSRLKERIGTGLLLFIGHGHSPINYPANIYPFRQDSSFLYYFGLDQPDLAVVMDIDRDTETLFGDGQTLEALIWEGPVTPLAERCAQAGLLRVKPAKTLETVIAEARRSGRKILYLPPYRSATVLKLADLLGIPSGQVKQGASRELIQAVVDQRAVKAAEELDEIEAAVNVTGQMHRAASAMARPGLMERDLVAAMTEICLAAGCQPAYPMILTVKGHVLHNTTCLNTLQEGDLVINDTGAESPGRYASDITRTFPVSGRFSPRQREVYEIVLSAQAEALETIRPGVRFLDVHLAACRALASGLKALGLMTGDPAEAVAAGAHALFFQCGLGHMLGLDVHDMEDLDEDLVGYDSQIQRSSQFGLRYLRMARELRPGFVLTVEPGLYFIPELIDRWRVDNRLSAFLNYPAIEKFRDFTGVRVEDDVVVTTAGYRLLGRPIPKSAAGIEEITGLSAQARGPS